MLKGEIMKAATLRKVSWEDGPESAARLWNQARETGEELVYRLNKHVRRHPWKAVAIGLAAGALLRIVVSRSARA
jgi:ElaB/YqjD/DUF883 family membrane-anchored ribosome-binding protein